MIQWNNLNIPNQFYKVTFDKNDAVMIAINGIVTIIIIIIITITLIIVINKYLQNSGFKLFW